MIKSIIVLSPHFDDSVLSLCDHMLYWKQSGYSIQVINIFTNFSTPHLSQDAYDNISNAGFTDVEDFAVARALEDSNAMKLLKPQKVESLGFTDAGFRVENGCPSYSNFSKIFDSHHNEESALSTAITSRLKKIITPQSFVAIPLGVGNHIDHVITRAVAENIVPKQKRIYYADFPYASKNKNWKLPHLFFHMLHPPSKKLTSQTKKRILSSYTTQIPILFSEQPNYEEMVYLNYAKF